MLTLTLRDAFLKSRSNPKHKRRAVCRPDRDAVMVVGNESMCSAGVAAAGSSMTTDMKPGDNTGALTAFAEIGATPQPCYPPTLRPAARLTIIVTVTVVMTATIWVCYNPAVYPTPGFNVSGSYKVCYKLGADSVYGQAQPNPDPSPGPSPNPTAPTPQPQPHSPNPAFVSNP